MCGIAGFVSKNGGFNDAQIGIIIQTVLNSMSRGKDATGVLYDKADGNFYVKKHGVSADDFFDRQFDAYKELSNSRYAMFHVRQGTGGHPRYNVNNHPIIGKKYTVIHNGIVNGTEKIKGYKYKSECDTELIVAQLDANGVEDGLKNIVGSASLIIYEHATRRIFLWRCANPLKIVYDVGNELLCLISDEDHYANMKIKISLGDIELKKKNDMILESETSSEMLYRLDGHEIIRIKSIAAKGYYSGYTFPGFESYDDKWRNRYDFRGGDEKKKQDKKVIVVKPDEDEKVNNKDLEEAKKADEKLEEELIKDMFNRNGKLVDRYDDI